MNVLITGCSKGIGKALLSQFLDNGHRVLSISRSKTDLPNTLNKDQWKEIQGDLLDETVYNEVTKGLDEWGKLDALINNAGYLISKSFDQITYEEVKRSFDVNYYASFKMSQVCIPFLKKAENASHINISSIGGVQGSLKFPGLSAYSSSKGAQAILTECLAEEFKDTSIHFNCLALGAVQTEMLEAAFPGYQAPYSPAEMATYIYHFIKNSSPMMNGKIISVSSSNP